MIKFHSVTKTYPDGTTAVDDLSLTVDTGTLTVFVGPSGCGKTTSMRMVNKMIEPTKGRIEVDGRDVAVTSTVPHRLGIGYVIQNAGLLPHRTVLDNVATVLRLKKVHRAEAREKAREALERVSLPLDLADRYPAQLSGGQQQRVGVARALAADPPILLMDEPFSAVDPVVRAELQQEIVRLQQEIRKTIIFVTHDIDEALLLGDAIAVFGPGGSIQQYADGESVLTQPANDFVADLVGQDRGYRALSFQGVADVSTRELPAADSDGIYWVNSSWGLVLDASGRPRGWRHQDGGAIIPIGSTARSGSTLRAALDAVLSSPASVGVIVDEVGVVSGLLADSAVNQAIASREWARQ